MRWIIFALITIRHSHTPLSLHITPASGQANHKTTPIFGIKIPAGYTNTRLISIAHQKGTLDDLHAILGNNS